jgi:hypothetical protein
VGPENGGALHEVTVGLMRLKERLSSSGMPVLVAFMVAGAAFGLVVRLLV